MSLDKFYSRSFLRGAYDSSSDDSHLPPQDFRKHLTLNERLNDFVSSYGVGFAVYVGSYFDSVFSSQSAAVDRAKTARSQYGSNFVRVVRRSSVPFSKV